MSNSRMIPIFSEKKRYVIFDWANTMFRAASVTELDRFIHLLSLMLYKYKKKFRNWEFVFALEGRGSDHRRKILPGYKDGRSYQEDVHEVMHKATELLNYMRCATICAPNGEADDAVACFLHQRARGCRSVIVSEDRDLWQLIQPHVTVLTRQQGEITPEVCYAKKGVGPGKIPLYKALFGDTSDRVPRGVPRMKTKTLLKLANLGTSPRRMYVEAVRQGVLLPKELERLVKYRDRINTNFSVVSLNHNLKLEVETHESDPYGLKRFVSENSVRSISLDQAKRIAR